MPCLQVSLGSLGARLTMSHTSVARMRDTPAAAATAAENSTAAAQHSTAPHRTHTAQSRVKMPLSCLLVMVLCSLHMRGLGPGCLNARMVHTTFTVSLACHMFCKWHRRQNIG